jgi:geranylgeranyl diphosphate synthase type II
MIRAAVRCGGLLGGATGEPLRALTRYGQDIGLAFQITDDILGQVGDERKLGKPVGDDEARQKATYPRAVGLEAARERALQLCRSAQEALAPLGERGDVLRAIAEFIVVRQF